jgi:hypothetical protein
MQSRAAWCAACIESRAKGMRAIACIPLFFAPSAVIVENFEKYFELGNLAPRARKQEARS